MNRCKVLIVAGALLCSTAGAQDQRFENPPQEARPYVWWHWINGNTSKDGIRKDLEWMNRIGIAGFHQFDAGGTMMQGLPPVVPQTPYLSDAWKKNFAYAIHLADSLGMEVGIASAPGWSSTGGPWVKPEDAMKKLTWRTLEVKGNGKSQTLTLPEPYKTIGRFQNVSAGIYAPVFEKMPQWYQDIAVVAVRVPEAEKTMLELGATVTSSGGDFTVEQLTNGDINDGPELALNKEGTGGRTGAGTVRSRSYLRQYAPVQSGRHDLDGSNPRAFFQSGTGHGRHPRNHRQALPPDGDQPQAGL